MASQQDTGASSSVHDSKRKTKEHQVQTTLFVSSIPFTATSTDLSTLFSDVGPLKRAFVVTDKETGKSKGVGYVTFALLEDAQRAAIELQGKSLDGKRKMRIEWAEKKAFGGRKKIKAEDAEGDADQTGDILMQVDGEEKRLSPETKPPSSRRSNHSTDLKDKDAVRTIVMTGLAACKPAADEKTLYKRTRKIGDVEKIVYPAPLSIMSTELSNDVAYIVYRTPNHAMTAVEKLHAHTFKGAQISVVLKKRVDGVAKLDSRMRPETKEKREQLQKKIEEEREQIRIAKELVKDQPLKGVDVNRGSRLIVRNLPFDVTDRDLRAIFLPYGPVYSIDVPQKVVAMNQASAKGEESGEDSPVVSEEGDDSEDLGVSSDDDESEEESSDDDSTDSSSEEGIDESSKSSVSPSESAKDTVEIDATSDAKPSKGRGFAFVWMVSRNDAINAIKHVNGITIGRGAAEKAQLRSAKGKAGREAAKKALEEVLERAKPGRPVAVDWALSKKEWEQKKDESEAEDTDKEEDERESDNDSVDKDEDDSMKGDDGDDEDDKKPSLPAPSEQTTLFIRNLPYQSTEVELRDVFRAFGPLRYAKITIDKATRRPKGTGFVCFWQKESADKALQQARLVEREINGSGSNSTLGQQNPFSVQSILTADPSAAMTASLNLHGRVLAVTLAVEKDTAENLSNKNRSARDKKDKRNTFLMREGVPLPGTPLASIMNEKEKEKRLSNFSIRKNQITKNPSLFISKTRLSVRQLPLYVSHKMLKKIGIHAVREFDAQVKRGERNDLTVEEKEDSKELMDEMHLKRGVEKDEAISKKKMNKFVGERSTAVIQSKVMLQNDRIDSITGLGRSRGYGFLEMRSYADALKAVRFINGDKTLSKLIISWYAAELESMVKGISRDVEQTSSPDTKEDSEERKSRLKRVEKKLAMVKEGKVDVDEGGGRGGSIMAEFSIENIVITKKRKERAEHSQSTANKRKRMEGDGGGVEVQEISTKSAPGRSREKENDKRGKKVESQEQAFKKQKVARRENWNQKTTLKGKKVEVPMTEQAEAGTAEPKLGSQMGSLIGRKRKEKKGKK